MLSTPYQENVRRHPVFLRETRRAWPREHFRRRSLRVLALTAVVTLLVWALLTLLWYLDAMHTGFYTDRPLGALYDAGLSTMALLLLGGILADGVLDLACMRAGITSISGEVSAGRWDLLRLTALHERGIVNAKHAVTQLRSWRMMTIVAGARGTIVIISLFWVFIMPIPVFGYSGSLEAFFYSFRHNSLAALILLLVVLLTAMIFILEPLWRLKAMAALSLTISAHVGSTTIGALAAFGATLGVWLAQAFIALGFNVGATFVITLSAFSFSPDTSLIPGLFFLLIAVLAAITIYGFYHLLQQWSLRRALERIRNAN